ncbi:MAG: phosphatidic acid phosphatase [Lachnospiraceae bacterium]|jgi:membrane-associated phospholipid phosphatase|nr:phosphatidic acid phosphatase [Lachnospiraceae bacterium]
MQRIKKILPREMWISLFLVVICNALTYYGARLITSERYHYDLTSWIDEQIPFVPWTLGIYWSCYLFWLVNYIIGCRQDVKCSYRFVCADLFAKVICLLCFLLLPTTNERPSVFGDSIWDKGIRLLYQIDAADNLFPSIHCLTSQFSLIAVRDNEKVPLWYRVVSLLFVVSICISTLTTKQHVLIDMAAGILLAEGSYLFVDKSRMAEKYSFYLNKFTTKFWKGRTA